MAKPPEFYMQMKEEHPELTTIDGIRMPWLNDAVREVNGGLDSIDFQSLSSIDVVRGANSSQLGSGALGGALQLRTLSPDDLLGNDDNFAGLVKSDYDSADRSWGLNAALAGRINDTAWLLQAGASSCACDRSARGVAK